MNSIFKIPQNDIPMWIKLPYTLLVLIVIPVYWYKYDVTNFLWFSDIALFAMVPALWYKNRFITSMMAIGVLPLESLWLTSLISGGAFLGMANYMFDPNIELWLRLLSLWHFPMPAVIIYMLYRFGYDKRALIPQIFFSLTVIAMTHLLAPPSENINIIYPPQGIEGLITQPMYSILMPIALITCSIIPMHFILKKIAPIKD